MLGEFDELQERHRRRGTRVSRRVERRPALCQGRLIGRSDQLVEVGQVGERVGEGTVATSVPPRTRVVERRTAVAEAFPLSAELGDEDVRMWSVHGAIVRSVAHRWAHRGRGASVHRIDHRIDVRAPRNLTAPAQCPFSSFATDSGAASAPSPESPTFGRATVTDPAIRRRRPLGRRRRVHPASAADTVADLAAAFGRRHRCGRRRSTGGPSAPARLLTTVGELVEGAQVQCGCVPDADGPTRRSVEPALEFAVVTGPVVLRVGAAAAGTSRHRPVAARDDSSDRRGVEVHHAVLDVDRTARSA